MQRKKVGDYRYLKNPVTKRVEKTSKILGILTSGEVTTTWGLYEFQAWLEEDARTGIRLISFPYYRNGRFGGQTTLRAEPRVVSRLLTKVREAGWFDTQ